jgi:hypothetical protein
MRLSTLFFLFIGIGLIATVASPSLVRAQVTSVQMGVDGMI